MDTSYKKNFINGVKWTGIHGIGLGVINVLKIAILSRLLDQAVFGYFAIALLVLNFTKIFSELGIGVALFHKKEISQVQYSSLYLLNMIVNVLLYLILLALTPLISGFYAESILQLIIPVVGINLIFNAIGSHFLIYAQKEFRFDDIAKIDLAVHLGGLTLSVILAYLGFGIWSLVGPTLFNALGISLGYFLLMKKKFPLLLVIKFAEVADFFRIGLYMAGSQIISYFSNHLDTIVIGKLLGMEVLGGYNIIKEFAMRIYGVISSVINKVAVPMFSSFNDNETLLKTRMVNLVVPLSFVNAILYSNLAALSYYVLTILFGDKYNFYETEFQMLCAYYLIMSIFSMYSTSIVFKGKTDYGFYWTIFRIVVTLPLIILLGMTFGIKGIIIATLIFILQAIYTGYRFIYRHTLPELRWSDYIGSFGSNLLFGGLLFVVSTFVLSFIDRENFWVGLCFSSVAVILINLAAILTLKRSTAQKFLKLAEIKKFTWGS